MGLKFTKKVSQAVKPQVEQTPAEDVLDVTEAADETVWKEAIDKVGRLTPEALKIAKKIKALQAELAPYNEAVKELQVLVDADDSVDPDSKDYKRDTDEYRLQGGAVGTSREIIDMTKLLQKLNDIKPGLAYELAKVTLKDIDTYMSKDEQKKFVKENRTKRTITVVPLPKAAKA